MSVTTGPLPDDVGPFTIKLADVYEPGSIEEIEFTWEMITSRNYSADGEDMQSCVYQAKLVPAIGPTINFGLAINMLTQRAGQVAALVCGAMSLKIATAFIYPGGKPAGISIPLSQAVLDEGQGNHRLRGVAAAARLFETAYEPSFDLPLLQYFQGVE